MAAYSRRDRSHIAWLRDSGDVESVSPRVRCSRDAESLFFCGTLTL